MKTPKPALLLCAMAFASSAHCADTGAAGDSPAPVEDIAQFSNGDTLRGALAGCDKAGLHWQTVYESQPVVVSTKYLKEIILRPRKSPANAAQTLNDVVLTNGDMLPGALISFDGKSFLLDTWYAGRLAIPRSMVRNITASAVIYKGPAGMEGWVIDPTPAHENTWTCQDGILGNTGFGTIGRDMKLPALARIQFDLDLSFALDQAFQANIYICADRASNPGSFYMFQIHPGFDEMPVIDFAHYSRDTTITNIGDPVTLNGEKPPATPQPLTGAIAPPAKATGGNTHFDIRINKQAKTIRLYINGKMVREYSSLNDLPAMGGGLIFSSANQNSPLRIGKIQVGAWSGGPDAPGDDSAAANDDRIDAANRDSVRGKLKEIAGGKVVIVSGQGEVEIPLGEIESISLSSEAARPPETAADDVRALLLPQGRVTMQIESWDAKGVAVTSPDFGRAVFSPEVFRRLRFNLQNLPAQGNEDAVDTDGGDDGD